MSSSKVASEIVSALRQCLDALPETVKLDGNQANSDEEYSGPSTSTCLPSMRHGISNQYAGSDREFLGRCHGFAGDTSQQHLRVHGSAVGNESDPHDNMKAHNGIGLTSRSGLENTNHCSIPGISSRPMNGLEQKLPSLVYGHSSFERQNHFVSADRNCVSGTERPSNGTVTNYSVSRRDNYPRRNSTGQVPWYIDGDSASMEIFSASKQLWLGYMGPNICEAHVRYEVERFGPVESYFFHPRKGFALVEYRSIIDSVKARDNMRRHLPWRVRFMDTGLGTKGIINGVVVGYSSFVYVGNILNQGAKDELIHETKKVLPKGPYMATDLFYEGAVLLEFETPEDAAAIIAHLRQHRREMIRCTPPPPVNFPLAHMDHPRSVSTSFKHDDRAGIPANITNAMVESPHSQKMPQSPADSSQTRISQQLVSLISSLSTKYNIANWNAPIFREENNLPSSSLLIYNSKLNCSRIMDDEVLSMCRLAIDNIGCVLRVNRTNMQGGCGWLVDCGNVDAATTILRNLRCCPGAFLQIEYRFASHS